MSHQNRVVAKKNWIDFEMLFFFKSVNQATTQPSNNATQQEQHVIFKDPHHLLSLHAPEKQDQPFRKHWNFHPSVSSAHIRRAVQPAQ